MIKDRESKNHYIVAIGASAGGLEALQKLLDELSPKTGFSFIIIQHLSADYKSLLTEILSKNTKMPIHQAENDMEVLPDNIYIIAPGKNMTIKNNKLQLVNQKQNELNLPIDLFLRSLALEAKSKAIAIILSGTGSDGTNGIKDIKEQDGMIIVQNPDTAKFDGMPRSALRTGLVDVELSLDEIAQELRHISDLANNKIIEQVQENFIDEEIINKIYKLLKDLCNINFTHYKKSTILRRIERRMVITHKASLDEYLELLKSNSEEIKTLSKELLIGVTSFFRDEESFKYLKDYVLTNIIKSSKSTKQIRIWVAGCSTGEEAYSIAILIFEVMEELNLFRDIKIFATDLDKDAIFFASKGIFAENIVNNVSALRLSKFFVKKNDSYIINRDIRKMIVFSPHNVFQDPPFGHLDLISCRNMLIYFDSVLQNNLFSIFHASLNDQGYLFLGKSEAIGLYTDAFPIINAKYKIFTHLKLAKINGQKPITFFEPTSFNNDTPFSSSEKNLEYDYLKNVSEEKIKKIDNALFEQFMPTCLVINDKNEIVHIYGDSTNFIHVPGGKFSNSVFDLLVESLKIPASTILKESRTNKCSVEYRNIPLKVENEVKLVNMTSMSITKNLDESDDLYALVFTLIKENSKTDDSTFDINKIAHKRISDLEQELQTAQKKLKQSLAEQGCVNEELQSANEELLTANEELQSSNEELQSVNEELYSVNSEYQIKLSELAELNDDLANFLSSTLTGIIFVDHKLNIRRFTNYISEEFSLMENDIGRPLKVFSYQFLSLDISNICENVLKTLIPDEREIKTNNNKIFFSRISPYRTTENKILGCVITFIDITKQKLGQFELTNAEEKLNLAKEQMEANTDYLTHFINELNKPINDLKKLTEILKDNLNNKENLIFNLNKLSKTTNCLMSMMKELTNVSKEKKSKI